MRGKDMSAADFIELQSARTRWDQVLRQAVKRLPDVHFRAKGESSSESIALVDKPEWRDFKFTGAIYDVVVQRGEETAAA